LNNSATHEISRQTAASDMVPPARIVFVDLDGTLVATDLLCESLLLALRQDPTSLLQVPRWILRGRAGLKRGLAERVQPDPRHLPYRENVLQFIRQQRESGARIVLATASDHIWAKPVAEHLGMFDDVIASDGQHNLKGSKKLDAIEAYCARHGYEEFAYIGDSTADLPIWQRAAQAYVVQPSVSLARTVSKTCRFSEVLGVPHSRPRVISYLMQILRNR
jgi:phosphoserine phosphatase